MKIVSWNVNGIRACLDKGFMKYFRESDADIFCVQETKLSEYLLTFKKEGYHEYWNFADKKGYSGTLTLSRDLPISVSYGLGVEKFDKEGRIITAEYKDFYLVNVYVPNSQEGLARLGFKMSWNIIFRDLISKLQKIKPVVICGDLNVSHKYIDLANAESRVGYPGFSINEREDFDKLLSLGMTDVFRHLYPDKVEYSYWSYMRNSREKNLGWRLDYFIVSNLIVNNLIDVKMRKDILGSDHGPIELLINI